jgi:hypothetical protein
MNDHWYTDTEWRDAESSDGYPHVRPVHVVRGPAPFDRLEAQSKEHANEVAAELNRVYERKVPDPEPIEEEPDETTEGLTAAFRDALPDFSVSASGRTITINYPCS